MTRHLLLLQFLYDPCKSFLCADALSRDEEKRA
jgi:hypothetical protein